VLVATRQRASYFVRVFAAVLTLAGCAAGGDTPTQPDPQSTPVKLVLLSPAAISVVEGRQEPLTATVRDADGGTVTGRVVTWAAADTGVASVDAAGVVTGKRAGSTTVTASAAGVSATAAVTVSLIPVSSVSVALNSPTLVIGQTAQAAVTPRDDAGAPLALTGRTVAFESSNPVVATVSETGVITAVAPGDATIAATVGGQCGAAVVTVVPPAVATVTLVANSPSVVVGASTRVVATVRDSGGNALAGRAVTYASSAPAVATVDGAGLVAAVAVGTATITATVDGQSGSAVITVAPVPVAVVALVADRTRLTRNVAARLVTTLRDADGNVLTGRPVTYVSSNPGVAAVVENSEVWVRGGDLGTATVTATSEGRSAAVTISVETDVTPPTLASLAFSPSSVDVTSAAATVVVTERVIDSVSGPVAVLTMAHGPAGPSGPRYSCGGHPVSGTVIDVTFRCTLTIPRGSPPGTWTVGWVEVGDALGNTRTLRTADLAAAGIATTFTVTNDDWPDVTPPALVEFRLAQSAVDVTSGQKGMGVSYHLRDIGSGIQSSRAVVDGPPGSASPGATCSGVAQGASVTDSWYVCNFVIPQGSAPGTWTVRTLTVTDRAGNTRVLSTADLNAAGFPTTFTVINTTPAPEP
jgi:uncharacterized protein YjdB